MKRPASRPSTGRSRRCRCDPGRSSGGLTTTSATESPTCSPALNLATGQVVAQTRAQHRAVEFRKFLDLIDESVPAGLAVHVVLDNSSTHKTPAIHDWLLKHPRFQFHFTPTSSSWMNLVERWFAELTTKMLQRSAHKSVAALTADLNAWVAEWNDNPRPFVWHKSA